MNRAYLGQPPDDDITDAISWCTGPIDIGGRHSRYSLLTLDQDDRFNVNDYVQDHDHTQEAPPVPGHVWVRALENAPDHTSVWNIGFAADAANQLTVAQAAWELLAAADDADAMNNLAFLLAFSGKPKEALHWYWRAVKAGSIRAMTGMGRLFEQQADAIARAEHDAAAEIARQTSKKARQRAVDRLDELGAAREDMLMAARSWYEAAVERGDRTARPYLGAYLESYAPAEARRWYEREAEAGDTEAAYDLGNLLAQADPAEAQRWYEQAAEAGDTSAMNNLGVLLLRNGKPDEARRWLERAAQAGDEGAARNLRALQGD
jgi:TPR repeat protein